MVWRCMSESVRVIVVLASRVLEVISSRVRPPEDRPVSRICDAVIVDGPVERLAEGHVEDARSRIVV